MSNLPVEHINGNIDRLAESRFRPAGPLTARRSGFDPPGATHDLERVADGCERVPQLMGEHRQEFTFAAVRFAQRVFHLLASGDVIEAIDGSHDVAGFVLQWTDIHDDGDPRAIGPFDEHFRVARFRQGASDDFGHRTLLVRHETTVRTEQFERPAKALVGIA